MRKKERRSRFDINITVQSLFHTLDIRNNNNNFKKMSGDWVEAAYAYLILTFDK